jgi:hypothetical protein
MAWNNYRSQGGLSAFEIKERSDPQKYLYDALDAYNQVSIGEASKNLALKDILLLKTITANDAENIAKGLGLLGEDYDIEIEEFTNKITGENNELAVALKQVKVATYKVRLIIAAMKDSKPLNLELKA